MYSKKIIYPSANKLHDIHAYVWNPVKWPKAIIQIAHGMSEYMMRYDDFAIALTQAGFLVCGNDHAGHGSSVSKDGVFGFFGEKDGYKFVAKDFDTLRRKIREQYPDLPYFILGHSMGSLITRYYIGEYRPDLNGYICMGTSGGNMLTSFGILFSSVMKKLTGARKPGKLIDKIAFGNYNKKILEKRTANDWLSRDQGSVDKYSHDKRSGFIFTNAGFNDLFRLLKIVSAQQWANSLPDVPMLILSGEDDPVGDYGKGVKKFYLQLTESGHNQVTFKLYPHARHELLHEINKQEVYSDIIEWLKMHLSN